MTCHGKNCGSGTKTGRNFLHSGANASCCVETFFFVGSPNAGTNGRMHLCFQPAARVGASSLVHLVGRHKVARVKGDGERGTLCNCILSWQLHFDGHGYDGDTNHRDMCGS